MPASLLYPAAMAEDPACCGACAHLARVARDGPAPRPAAPPLRLRVDPSGAPLNAVLVVVGAGQEFPLRKSTTTIGRSNGADVSIQDVTLSRLTARILVDPDGQCHIEDMHSACGVTVNDARVQRVGLHAGDEIRLGDHTLRVEAR